MKIRKLDLKRETVRELTPDQLGQVAGAGDVTNPQQSLVIVCLPPTYDCVTFRDNCYSSPGMPC